MAGFRLDDYISFEVMDESHVQNAEDLPSYNPVYVPDGPEVLPDQAQNTIEQALSQIAGTPEGRQLIKDAAEASPSGQVHIVANTGGGTFAFDGTFVLGSADAVGQYLGTDGEYHDFSIQRILVHELKHVAEDHLDQDRLLTDLEEGNVSIGSYGYIAEYEDEAMGFANDFMHKYYREVPRASYEDFDVNPDSPAWENNSSEFFSVPFLRGIFKAASAEGVIDDMKRSIQTASLETSDPNFVRSIDSDELRSQLNSISPEQLATLGPEMEMLHLAGADEVLFNKRLESFEGNAHFEVAHTQIQAFAIENQPVPTVVAEGQQWESSTRLGLTNNDLAFS